VGVKLEKCKICGVGSFVEGMIGSDSLCADCRAEPEADGDESRWTQGVDKEDHADALTRLRKQKLQDMLSSSFEVSEPVRGLPFAFPQFLESESESQRRWAEWTMLTREQQYNLLLSWAAFVATTPTSAVREPAELVTVLIELCAEIRNSTLVFLDPAIQTEPEEPVSEEPGPVESGGFGKGFGK